VKTRNKKHKKTKISGARFTPKGYKWTHALWNHIFNVFFASLFIIIMAPVFVFISILILIVDGRPIFYAGTRLGKAKRPFTMYKFRTLKRGAEDIIGARILEVHHKQGTSYGKFLRETRLDELPQLFNIIRRDMDLVGPRPIRPALYESICKKIPSYDRHFDVNAGLIGYAQLFTPHDTPKRIRVLIDNTLVKHKMEFIGSISVLAFTGYIVISTTVQKTIKIIRYRFLDNYSEKRNYERRSLNQTQVMIANHDDNQPFKQIGWVNDINEEAFLILIAEPLAEPLPDHFKLSRTMMVRRQLKTKTTRCHGTLYRQWKTKTGEYAYVFTYKPDSPLMAYQIQQYFLESSFA